MGIRKISLEDDDFKLAFIRGTLAIDCLEITLTQKGSSEPRIYQVAGSIFVSPENGAEARLVWKRDDEHPYDPFGSLNAAQSVKSGQLFSDDHYFSLRAIDIAGNCWTHPSVLLKRDEKINAEILTISCDFIQVEMTTNVSRALAHFVFSGDLEIPLNRALPSNDFIRGRERLSIKTSVSAGSVAGLDISYYPLGADKGGPFHELTAVSQEGSEPPVDFQMRFLEAVQFCVAKLAKPIMEEVVQGGKTTITLSKSQPFNAGLVSPPLPKYAWDDFYHLMNCYYKYACTEANGADGAPLSKKIGGLFTLKGVWIETVALLLSVSVESILKDPAYDHLGKPGPGLMAKLKTLFDWIKSAPVEKGLIDRATSAIGSMKSNRAVDKMFVLAKAGVVEEAEINAWKSLRNPTAHGSFELDPSKLQDLLDDVYRLIAMIYKLAFFKIGYQGKYSNYASRGWREAIFDAEACKIALEKPDSTIE